MTQSEIKRKVRRFRREFHIKDCTAEAIEEIFRKQGFTVINFTPVLNDPDVDTVIRAFNLEDLVARANGFIFMDRDHRLVFIKEGLAEEERKLVLAHEEGHYYLGHTSTSAFIGRNVMEEYEANEFAHFLLTGTLTGLVRDGIRRHKKAVIAGVVAGAVAGGAGIGSREYARYQERQLYEGEYYVTMHGEKYHLEGCVTIQGHETRRLTKEDAEAGIYEPCSVCQPEK